MNHRVLTCVYCGHEYPQDTPAHGNEVLTEHIRQCEKHPMRELEEENRRLKRELQELSIKEGPLNSERWTLDTLMEKLNEWKRIASGSTCVSFENLCFGASSLWHQTHRENFRKIDRKPEALSRWVLEYSGHIREDFPAQVLELLDEFFRGVR